MACVRIIKPHKESPGVYIQGQRIFIEKVRNVFVMGLRASPSSSSILQHLKVNRRLQTLISKQLYTQSLYSMHIR